MTKGMITIAQVCKMIEDKIRELETAQIGDLRARKTAERGSQIAVLRVLESQIINLQHGG